MPKIKTLVQVVGENVGRIRAAKKLSQPAVAAAAKRAGAKINQTTVGRIERGVYPATLETIEALAKGLGELPWQLLIPEGRDEKFLAILKAWSQADEEGRRVLFRIADALVQRDPAVEDGGTGETRRGAESTGADRR